MPPRPPGELGSCSGWRWQPRRWRVWSRDRKVSWDNRERAKRMPSSRHLRLRWQSTTLCTVPRLPLCSGKNIKSLWYAKHCRRAAFNWELQNCPYQVLWVLWISFHYLVKIILFIWKNSKPLWILPISASVSNVKSMQYVYINVCIYNAYCCMVDEFGFHLMEVREDEKIESVGCRE